MNKDFYRVFSCIFHMPDLEFIGYLRSGFLADIQYLTDDVRAGFRRFLDEHADKDDEHFYRMLAVEYTRLFVNGMHGVEAPPYESMYRENTIMGESTVAVVRKYKEAGLEVLDNFCGLPDHIAVELEFLHYLAARNEAERHDTFLREHLSQWVQAFSQAIERNALIDFYRLAGEALAKAVTTSLAEVTISTEPVGQVG